jgi:rubrerythrin
MSTERRYVIEDTPSCEFLKKNLKAEMDAIEGYTDEADRTDDIVWKRAISSIAQDEMRHHQVLESLAKQLKCNKD